MASFAQNKIDITAINGGQRYQNGDLVSPEAINAPIEASARAQAIAEETIKQSTEALSKAEQALNYGIGNTQGTFPVLTAYPIGSIYLSVNSTSPAQLFGGTWEKLTNRFLLGAGNLYNLGDTGGEATHTLTVAEMPKHTHTEKLIGKTLNGAEGNKSATGYETNIGWWTTMVIADSTEQTGESGSSQAHNNMPPYLAVNMWKRIA